MIRRSIPFGGVVACDMPGCSSKFTTYSVVTLARKQAAADGWDRIKGSMVTDQGASSRIRLGEGRPVSDVPPGTADGWS